jgi:hypothetical protein
MTRDKTVVVITSLLATFKAKGCRWEHIAPAEPGLKCGIRVLSQELGEPLARNRLVAEFTDVHAVFFEDDVDLVELGDILEEG